MRWAEARICRGGSGAGAAPLHEETEPSGFLYYTRYFRSTGGGPPEPRDRLLAAMGSVSILTLPGDNGTWSVTLFGSSDDRPLTQLRDADRWTSVVAACPLHAHWLDGEPITRVMPMAGVLDRYRRLVVNDHPVVTGVALVADAWACTNPSLGRGVALGLAHAARLRDVVKTERGDPEAFALAWDHVTETELTPWYRATVALDRARLAEIEAIRTGGALPRPSGPAAALGAALARAMPHDPDIFRAFTEIVGCLKPSRRGVHTAGLCRARPGGRGGPRACASARADEGRAAATDRLSRAKASRRPASYYWLGWIVSSPVERSVIV